MNTVLFVAGDVDSIALGTAKFGSTLALAALAAKAPPRDLAGLDVEVFPLFEVLDGTDSGDYEQRVEPSVRGGEKIARALLARIHE